MKKKQPNTAPKTAPRCPFQDPFLGPGIDHHTGTRNYVFTPVADSTRHMRNSAARLREKCCFNQHDLAPLRKRLFLLFEVVRKLHFRREALRSAKSRTPQTVHTDPQRSSTHESTNQTHADIRTRCRRPSPPTANGSNSGVRSVPNRKLTRFGRPQRHESHIAASGRSARHCKCTGTKLRDKDFFPWS